MYKVTKEALFTHDVKVMVPVDGGHSEQSLKATFRVIPVDEMTDTHSIEGQQKMLKRVVAKLDDLVGDDDQPVSYSDDLRDQLIAVPYVRTALVQHYVGAVTKARAGN